MKSDPEVHMFYKFKKRKIFGERSALFYHCFMLNFQFAECYAQAISRTKQYERKLGTARKGKRKNKRKAKGT